MGWERLRKKRFRMMYVFLFFAFFLFCSFSFPKSNANNFFFLSFIRKPYLLPVLTFPIQSLQLSSDSEHDSYFTDPHASPSNHLRPPAPRARTDEQGYIIRRSVLEEGTRPEYIIPVGSAGGVWGMMKRVGRFRAEGWLALWKGKILFCFNLL